MNVLSWRGRCSECDVDEAFVLSSVKDHVKEQCRHGFKVERVPEFGNYFSELRHYPAYQPRKGDAVKCFENDLEVQDSSEQRGARACGSKIPFDGCKERELLAQLH